MLELYKFFSGGGMVGARLGPAWSCLLANDIDPRKCASYESNWGASELRVADMASLATEDLPRTADLAWDSPRARIYL